MSISPINLGSSFSTGSGSNALGGLSSGIDTKSIITSLVAVQSSQVTKLQDKIDVNNKQISTLSTLQQILTQFQTASAQLSTPQSPNSSTNVFASSSALITSNTTQAASNFLSVSAAATATPGTYTISNVTHLASASSQVSTTTFSSTSTSAVAATATAGSFTAGTYTIAGPSGSNTVTLTAGDSLSQVAQHFNDISSNTGIQASVLQTAPGVYKIVFNSTSTGASTAFDLSNATVPLTVNDGSGNPLSLGISFATPTAGQNAQFDFNGVTISRATNSFSDLVSGVSFDLLQDTSTQAGANFTIKVGPDSSTIKTAIENFASAYNNFLTFYAQQTSTGSDGSPASSATLYNDTTLRTLYNQLTAQASSIVGGLSSGSVNKLTDVGLTFGSSPATSTTPAISNLLYVDENSLTSTIENNLTGVENVFGYNLTSNSSNLASFSSATDPSVSNFTLNVQQTTPPASYSANYTDTLGTVHTVNFTASALGSGGVTLTADPASKLAGLLLIYTGTGDESINVSTTRGIASEVSNFLGTALTTNTGILATDTTGIQTSTTSLQSQITNINTQINTTRAQLLQKFSALETAITRANSALNLLNAQQLANSSG